MAHPKPAAAGGHPSVSALLGTAPGGAFSALEWSVIALAQRDEPDSLAEPSRLSRAFATLFPGSRDGAGADRRLEAIRRIAVIARHQSELVPVTEIRRFLAAGFTVAQYVLLQRSVGRGRREGGRP